MYVLQYTWIGPNVGAILCSQRFMHPEEWSETPGVPRKVITAFQTVITLCNFLPPKALTSSASWSERRDKRVVFVMTRQGPQKKGAARWLT